MLERLLEFLAEACTVPLMLSMLVLTFRRRLEGDTKPLPTDELELSRRSIAVSIAEAITQCPHRGSNPELAAATHRHTD